MYVFLRINLSTLREILMSPGRGSNITAMMRSLPLSMHSFLAICNSNSHHTLCRKFLLSTTMVFLLDSIDLNIFSSIRPPGTKSRSCMQKSETRLVISFHIVLCYTEILMKFIPNPVLIIAVERHEGVVFISFVRILQILDRLFCS